MQKLYLTLMRGIITIINYGVRKKSPQKKSPYPREGSGVGLGLG